MKHSQIQKQLSAYLDEELRSQEREEVEGHLRTCSECAEILLDLRQHRQWVANLRQPAPLEIWEAVAKRIENPNRRPIERKFRPDFSDIWRGWIFRPVSAGVGALVTVCLVLALVYFNPTQDWSEDLVDFYLMVHTDYATYSPLTINAGVGYYVTSEEVTTEESDGVTIDAATAGDTETMLDTYLAVYYLGE